MLLILFFTIKVKLLNLNAILRKFLIYQRFVYNHHDWGEDQPIPAIFL